jgi:hypothetical protein
MEGCERIRVEAQRVTAVSMDIIPTYRLPRPTIFRTYEKITSVTYSY